MDFITRVPIICSIRDYDNSIIDNEHYEIYTDNVIRVLSILNLGHHFFYF